MHGEKQLNGKTQQVYNLRVASRVLPDNSNAKENRPSGNGLLQIRDYPSSVTASSYVDDPEEFVSDTYSTSLHSSEKGILEIYDLGTEDRLRIKSTKRPDSTNSESRRKRTFVYNLKVDEKKIQVTEFFAQNVFGNKIQCINWSLPTLDGWTAPLHSPIAITIQTKQRCQRKRIFLTLTSCAGIKRLNTPILCIFMVCAMEVPCVPSLNLNDAFRTEEYHIEEYLLSMELDERLGIAKSSHRRVYANNPRTVVQLKDNIRDAIFIRKYAVGYLYPTFLLNLIGSAHSVCRSGNAIEQWSSALAEMCNGYAVPSLAHRRATGRGIESIPVSSYESTIVHCVLRGGITRFHTGKNHCFFYAINGISKWHIPRDVFNDIRY
ncbi:hypothetical protein ANN_08125 [Periplaneta americana]|uniref:Uncharacterized protein n=1 Tax=Periplaneta americana TaxID=6978 RepID=A0ABQ8T0K4_PERAM|nr:hypothetical protein ANN_08125 [Periplaneta americana]